MRSRRQSLIGVMALSLAACGGGSGASHSKANFTDPAPTGIAPAALADLSYWQLTLPVDADGATVGTAATIPTQPLLDGYDSAWIYGTEQDGITFWAPADGAHTANSPYARSELREVLDPADGSVNWSPAGFGSLSARVTVNRVPAANGKVTVGQVVGYNGVDPAIGELVRLIFEYNSNRTARVYALVFPGPYASGTTAQVLPIATAVKLSETFDYVITVEANVLTVRVDDVAVTAPVDPAWADVGLFFRAGVALHARGTDPADGGRVTFYALDVTH